MISNPKTGEQMSVRCGKCLPCQKFKAGQWTIRLLEQEKCTKNNYFITLTLSDEYLTWGFDKPTVVKRDLQLFFKKLRKLLDSTIKYYAVGEYGENTKRPHYHLILFNTGINDLKLLDILLDNAWSDSARNSKGFRFIRPVTIESIRYVAGYLEKGIFGEVPEENVHREFSLMSKGIGEQYIKNNEKYHKDNRRFEYRYNGINVPLPRYYRDRIFSEDEKQEYIKKIKESLPKRSIKQEEDDKQFRIERLRAKLNLKNKRK